MYLAEAIHSITLIREFYLVLLLYEILYIYKHII